MIDEILVVDIRNSNSLKDKNEIKNLIEKSGSTDLGKEGTGNTGRKMILIIV